MGNIFNPDFQDFIKALNQAEVRYILVGGYAVILHGYNRTTGDLDIWVDPTKENYQYLQKAFHLFGMPLFDMTIDNFLHNKEFDVFTFGVPPVSIDIMLSVKGLNFDEAYSLSEWRTIEGVSVYLINKASLLEAKRAAARFRDMDDIDHLS